MEHLEKLGNNRVVFEDEEIELKIETDIISASNRKLKAVWTNESTNDFVDLSSAMNRPSRYREYERLTEEFHVKMAELNNKIDNICNSYFIDTNEVYAPYFDKPNISDR